MKILHRFLYKDVCMQRLEVELLFLAVEERGLEDGLYLFVHAAILFLYNAREVCRLFPDVHDFFIAQGVDAQRDRSQRSLELVGHVVDEIVLYFIKFFLTKEGIQGGIEGGDDNQGEEDGAHDHDMHLAEDDVFEIGYDHAQHLVGKRVADIRTFGCLQRQKNKLLSRGILYFLEVEFRLQLRWMESQSGIPQIGGNGELEANILQTDLVKSLANLVSDILC